jgi:hypothetical protein
MVKEYISSLINHTRIDFVALRETPKAVLMKINHVESQLVKDLLNYYGADIMEPLQVWIPKGWLRMNDKSDDIWIWKEGLMKNLRTLAEKRLTKKLEPKPELKKVPKGETIH